MRSRSRTSRRWATLALTLALARTLALTLVLTLTLTKVYTLFVDVKRSTQFLVEYQNEFMFSEIQVS